MPDTTIAVAARRMVLSIQPGTMRVEVHKGIATIEGQVDRRTTAALAIRISHTVPGVIDVLNKIDYRYDDTEAPTWSAA